MRSILKFVRRPPFKRLPLVLVSTDPRRRLRRLASTATAVAAAAAMSAVDDGSCRINITNGLLLYYHQYSFYSQKVVMALHEKHLPFESHIVNITKGAQYEPWFLQLNPKGEVPVLQDTGKIIPDSTRIIDYLEDNFSNGDTPRLIPMDQGPEIRQKVTHFRHIIDQIPAGIITMGSFFHPELVENPKAPFFGPVRRILARAEKESSKTLQEVAEKNPESREVLLQKAAAQEKRHEMVVQKEEFLKVLSHVDDVLQKVEEELASHTEDKQDWWLCSDRFTAADIALTILLERLNQLGLEGHFWSKGKKPKIEKYYERVQQRDSYKKTIPNWYIHIKILVTSQEPAVIAIGAFTALAVLVGGVLLAKKLVVG